MSDRFRFRTPVYGPDGKFKDLIYWNAEEGAPAVSGRGGCLFKEPEQCTGLKDKNGTLIYEGDIIKNEVEEEKDIFGIISFGQNDMNFGFYVKWMGDGAEPRKYYPGWRHDLCFWLNEGWIVIGNIHENPEVLEEGK